MKPIFRTAALGALISGSLALSALAQGFETATINASDSILTMVNVLTPEPGKQAETIRLLQAGMNDEMSAQPGFISSTIHRSLNSDHVVVYAQWADEASVEAAVNVIQSGGAPSMAKVFSIAAPDFHRYAVHSVHPAQKN